VKASTKFSNLRVLIAQFDRKIAGYVVIGLNNNSAYYLHGASNTKYQIYRPNDLLFLSAIQWAKNEKMDIFNMMSSPVNQPTLIRYKEKWLGVTSIHKTYERDISPIFANCFRLANSFHQSLHSLLSRR
jgi:lipid II:glycine glycyltransferase (peptidoglycan interpeptide bridge formation enzyme)